MAVMVELQSANAQPRSNRDHGSLDIPRNQWGWPSVPDPDRPGRRLACHRPSGFGKKMLTDDYNIKQWLLRMVAKGAGLRPDLARLAGPLDPSDDKQALQKIADDMKDAAGGAFAANTGTAIHTICEKHLLGMPFDVPPDLENQVSAMLRELRAYDVQPVDGMVEPFLVCPSVPAAGSADAVASIGGSRPVIFDLKTGNDPRGFSAPLEYGVQLAIYANATHSWEGVNNGVDTPLVPMPDLDKTKGAILWVPSKDESGYAELIELDLEEAWDAVQLACRVRDQRRTIKKRFVNQTSWQRDDSAADLPDTVDIGESTLAQPDPAVDENLSVRGSTFVPATHSESENLRSVGLRLRNELVAAIEGAGADRSEIAGQWPDAPNLTSQLGEHTADSMAVVENYVELVCVRLGWYPVSREDREAVVAGLAELSARETEIVESVCKLEGVPNVNDRKFMRCHAVRVMAVLTDLASQRLPLEA